MIQMLLNLILISLCGTSWNFNYHLWHFGTKRLI